MASAPAAQALRRLLRRLFVHGGVGRDAGWAVSGEALQLAGSLLTFFLLTRTLGPEQYGRYAGVVALAAILATLTISWVVLLLLQEAIREGRALAQVVAACLGLAVPTGVAALVVTTLISPYLLPGIPVGVVALLVGAELLGGGMIQVAAGCLQVLEGFPAATKVRLAGFLARVAVVVTLFATGTLTVEHLAVALAVVLGAAGVGSLLVVRRRHHLAIRVAAPSRADVRRGFPYAASLLCFGLQEDADKTLMVRFGRGDDAGLYAAAYRGVQLGLLPIRALLSASHPRFLEPGDGAGHHLRKARRFTLAAGAYALVAATALSLASPLLSALLGDEYRGAERMVPFLAPLLVLRAASLFGFNGLMGLGRDGLRVGILVASTTTNLAANAVLIPLYSWRGAIAATVLAELTFAVATWLALVRAQRSWDRRSAGAPAARPAVEVP